MSSLLMGADEESKGGKGNEARFHNIPEPRIDSKEERPDSDHVPVYGTGPGCTFALREFQANRASQSTLIPSLELQ